MNNQSALDRLKEIEAEKKELEAALIAEKGNVDFPIYCRHKELNNHYKIISKHEHIKVDLSGGTYDSSIEHLKYFGTTTSMVWDYYWQDKTDPITPEEFEAARSEAINKLSNL